jgi:hypothetical protein
VDAGPNCSGRQPRGELVGHGLHSGGRHRRTTPDERPHEQVDEPPRRRAVALTDHAGEEGREDLVPQLGGDPDSVEPFAPRLVRRGEQVGGVGGGIAQGPRGERGDLARGSQRPERPGDGARPSARRRPAGVGEEPTAPAGRDDDADGQRSKAQRAQIEHPPGLGVGRVEELEAAVAPEAVDDVGTHPPAHGVGTLEQRHGDARGGQAPGARQPGEARADDDDLACLDHGRRVAAAVDDGHAERGGLRHSGRRQQRPEPGGDSTWTTDDRGGGAAGGARARARPPAGHRRAR